MLKLILPNESHIKEIEQYKKKFRDLCEIHGAGPLHEDISINDWYSIITKRRLQEGVVDGFVKSTLFLALVDDKIVGTIDIRHFLHGKLLDLGHIGYSIEPNSRRKGYAKEMLKQALIFAKDEVSLERVLIACDEDNTASKKTILSQGGIYVETIIDDNENVLKYWINI